MTTTQSRPVNNLTRWDLGRVNTLSRWYTTGKNAQESIDEIAEALELAQSPRGGAQHPLVVERGLPRLRHGHGPPR